MILTATVGPVVNCGNTRNHICASIEVKGFGMIKIQPHLLIVIIFFLLMMMGLAIGKIIKLKERTLTVCWCLSILIAILFNIVSPYFIIKILAWCITGFISGIRLRYAHFARARK